MDANTGSFVGFNEKTTTYDGFNVASLASSSIPGAFSPTQVGPYVLFDGGMVYSANLVSAVQRCREITTSDDQITVDIIITTSGKLELDPTTKEMSTIGNMLRYREIKDFENGLAGILKFMVDYP